MDEDIQIFAPRKSNPSSSISHPNQLKPRSLIWKSPKKINIHRIIKESAIEASTILLESKILKSTIGGDTDVMDQVVLIKTNKTRRRIRVRKRNRR